MNKYTKLYNIKKIQAVKPIFLQFQRFLRERNRWSEVVIYTLKITKQTEGMQENHTLILMCGSLAFLNKLKQTKV